MDRKIDIFCNFRVIVEKDFDTLKVSDEVKAYLSSLFLTMLEKSSENDIYNDSIVLAYLEAKKSGTFDRFRRVGDHITWTATVFPGRLSAHYDMAIDIARSSYYSCWRLLNKKWSLYEELGNDLPDIVMEARDKIAFLKTLKND